MDEVVERIPSERVKTTTGLFDCVHELGWFKMDAGVCVHTCESGDGMKLRGQL